MSDRQLKRRGDTNSALISQMKASIDSLIATHGTDKRIHNASAEPGIYWATYNFRNEADGTSGTDIDGIITDGITGLGGTLEIQAELDSHKKILWVDPATSFDICRFDLDKSGTSDTIEFWLYFPDTLLNKRILLREDGDAAIYLVFHDNNNIYYHNGVGLQDTGEDYAANIWYHHKFVFDITADTFDWYIDGVKIGTGLSFFAVATEYINILEIGSDSTAGHLYVDAIGISWDTDYNVGDNERSIDPIVRLTREGGFAVRLTNETGAASIRGTMVDADGAVDNAFDVAAANSTEAIGVVYEHGIADGAECLIVVGGRCQVLLKDATASTRLNWVEMSNVAGRVDATGASPAAAPQHFQEVGHCIENKAGGNDVLAFIMMHFL